MESSGTQSNDPKGGLEFQHRLGALNGLKYTGFGKATGQASLLQTKTDNPNDSEKQTDHSKQDRDSTFELGDSGLQLNFGRTHGIHRHNFRLFRAEPAVYRGSWNAQFQGDGSIPGLKDQRFKAMVILTTMLA